MRAFTLVEVVCIVAAIGVLASAALPAYSDFLRRSLLPEAFGALAEFRAKMEQYYQDHLDYGNTARCADANGAATWSAFNATEHFSFTCVTDSAQQGFTVTATGRSGAALGHVFSIDQKGDRKTSRFKGAAVSANCWLTKSNAC